jgi:hypothetical protein
MLYALDLFFVVFHALLVLFNLSGWAWSKTRRLHLIVLGSTFFSWLGLGLMYGFGYCPLTDWHWRVKRALGETDLPASYVKYYLDRLTGLDWDPGVVDLGVVVPSVCALILTVWLNTRDRARG